MLRKSLIAGALALFTGAAFAADPAPRGKPEDVGMSSERLALIAAAVNAEIAKDQLPGAVLAIARRGKLVYFEAFGYRDKAANIPMTTDSIFNIASMTKPNAAVAGLQMLEQGKLTMDEPVSRTFPSFARMQVAVMDDKRENIVNRVAANRQITIQDLYRHTSGMIYGGRGATAVHKMFPEGSSQASLSMTGDEFIAQMAATPLLWQPGSTWDYGFGLDVLGLAVEKTSGLKLPDYLQRNVWTPLGMTDTHFVVPADKAGRYAKPLPIDPETKQPQAMRQLTSPAKFDCGGGCMASTAGDYMRFAMMLLNKGTYGGQRILGRKTVEFMTSNHLAPDVKNLLVNGDPTRADYGFGLGVAVRTQPGVVRLIGSIGDFSWPGASGTNWWADPKEELAVVWMAHSPGSVRWKYRQMINALVYQALVD